MIESIHITKTYSKYLNMKRGNESGIKDEAYCTSKT